MASYWSKINVAILVFLSGGIYACSEPQRVQLEDSDWKVVKITEAPDKPALLEFANGKQYQTSLYEVKYLGQLPAKGKAPFLVLAGRGCHDCDIETSVYIHSPTDGPIDGQGANRYTYPGVQYETEEGGAIVDSSRMFLGRCLNEQEQVALWFHKTPDKNNTWLPSVFVARSDSTSILSGDVLGNMPKLASTLELVRKRLCKEVRGEADRDSTPLVAGSWEQMRTYQGNGFTFQYPVGMSVSRDTGYMSDSTAAINLLLAPAPGCRYYCSMSLAIKNDPEGPGVAGVIADIIKSNPPASDTSFEASTHTTSVDTIVVGSRQLVQTIDHCGDCTNSAVYVEIPGCIARFSYSIDSRDNLAIEKQFLKMATTLKMDRCPGPRT